MKLTAKIVFEMGWRASNAGLPRCLSNVEEYIKGIPLTSTGGMMNKHIRLWENWYRGYDSSTIMGGEK